MLTLAWIIAVSGLALGLLLAVVPGFPGCAVALLGVVAFAALHDFRVVTPEALTFCASLVTVAAMAQLAAPVVTSRAAGGAAGVATGAAVGAALGVWVPLPGASWIGAMVGAIVGGVVARQEGWRRAVRGVWGTSAGCCSGMVVDGAATLAIGAVLGVSDFLARLGA